MAGVSPGVANGKCLALGVPKEVPALGLHGWNWVPLHVLGPPWTTRQQGGRGKGRDGGRGSLSPKYLVVRVLALCWRVSICQQRKEGNPRVLLLPLNF